MQGLADLSQNVYYARASDDARYLSHDASGEPSPVGCAFSPGAPPDLSAPVTAVYGHSFAAGPLVFATRCSPARSLIA